MSTVALRRPFRAHTAYGRQRILVAALAASADAGHRFRRPEHVRVPDGYRIVTDHAHALAILDSVMPGRADAKANRRAINRALTEHVRDDRRGLIIAGHQRLADHAWRWSGRRIGRSCARLHVRALEAAGVLLVAQRGSSAAVNGLGRDIAPTYVVIAPIDVPLSPAEQVQLEALKDSLEDVSSHLPVRAGSLVKVEGSLGQTVGEIPKSTPVRREDPGPYVPRTAAERRIAIAWLAHRLHLDYEHFAKGIDNAANAFLDAGWCPEAIAYAAECAPGSHVGDPSLIADGLWPMKLLNARLNRWCEPGRTRIAAPPVAALMPRRGRRPRPAGAAVVPPGPPEPYTGPGPAARAALDAARAVIASARAKAGTAGAAGSSRRVRGG